MKAIAFVDYDNIKLFPDRSHHDVEINIDELLERTTSLVNKFDPKIREVEIRLYGGWICENGTYSRNGEWALLASTMLKGLRTGIRLLPTVIISAACCPYEKLLGTFRTRASQFCQKMVDSLLIVDAIHLANKSNCPFFLISNDDDMVPGALEVSTSRRDPCILSRLRPNGIGLNDSILQKNGVHLELFRP